jgi:hypothetical protein
LLVAIGSISDRGFDRNGHFVACPLSPRPWGAALHGIGRVHPTIWIFQANREFCQIRPNPAKPVQGKSKELAYNSRNAEYIKTQIADRINRSSMTVVYLSNDTPTSRWVEWEVKKAKELGKEVVATHKGDAAHLKLPTFLNELDIKIVPWAKLPRELKPN